MVTNNASYGTKVHTTNNHQNCGCVQTPLQSGNPRIQKRSGRGSSSRTGMSMQWSLCPGGQPLSLLNQGMAAMLTGVCRVPLASVLLLFELTRDYRIILPLMGAVGLSSWIASSSTKENKRAKNDLTLSPASSLVSVLQTNRSSQSLNVPGLAAVSTSNLKSFSSNQDDNGSLQNLTEK